MKKNVKQRQFHVCRDEESRKYRKHRARNYRLLYLKGNTKGGEDGKIM